MSRCQVPDSGYSLMLDIQWILEYLRLPTKSTIYKYFVSDPILEKNSISGPAFRSLKLPAADRLNTEHM